MYDLQLSKFNSNSSYNLFQFKGATASCPEIQGAGKPVDESATLDFGALAVEIVRSLEGRESNGVKPLISGEVHSDETNKPGLSECEWDDECESKQNQVVFSISRIFAFQSSV